MKNVLLVPNLKKIIPINENFAQFRAAIAVKSNGEPFKAAIVSQTRLEEKGAIEYQAAADGYIDYNITQNNNTPQMFFLVLLAAKEIEVEVSLDVQPLQVQAPPTSTRPPRTASGINWALILVLIAVLGGVVWFMFFNKKPPGANPPVFSSSLQLPMTPQALTPKVATPENRGNVAVSLTPPRSDEGTNNLMEKIQKYFENSP